MMIIITIAALMIIIIITIAGLMMIIIITKASRALKHAADVIADSPAALQVLFIIIITISIYIIIITIIIVILVIIFIMAIFSAPLPTNVEQHLSREQQHDHLPDSHRHHLTTVHCQTTEKGDLRAIMFNIIISL